MDAYSDHFLKTFIKYQLKTTVWKQIRSEQISFSVAVVKHCKIVKDNSFLESTQNQRCFNVKFYWQIDVESTWISRWTTSRRYFNIYQRWINVECLLGNYIAYNWCVIQRTVIFKKHLSTTASGSECLWSRFLENSPKLSELTSILAVMEHS